MFYFKSIAGLLLVFCSSISTANAVTSDAAAQEQLIKSRFKNDCAYAVGLTKDTLDLYTYLINGLENTKSEQLQEYKKLIHDGRIYEKIELIRDKYPSVYPNMAEHGWAYSRMATTEILPQFERFLSKYRTYLKKKDPAFFDSSVSPIVVRINNATKKIGEHCLKSQQ